jgi:hypothetical protein
MASRHVAVPGAQSTRNLGDELKALFDRVAAEPLPDRLTDLARELERRFEHEAKGARKRRSRVM